MKARKTTLLIFSIFMISMMTLGSSGQYLDWGTGGPASYYYYTVSGTVDASSCDDSGITVTISGGGMSGSDTTDSDGKFSITVARTSPGEVTFSMDVPDRNIDYTQSDTSVTVATNGEKSVSIHLHSSRIGLQVPDPCPEDGDSDSSGSSGPSIGG